MDGSSQECRNTEFVVSKYTVPARSWQLECPTGTRAFKKRTQSTCQDVGLFSSLNLACWSKLLTPPSTDQSNASFSFQPSVAQRALQPVQCRKAVGFSSLTTTIEAKLRELRLRKTFNEIDSGGKGFLNETDLAQYARRTGLPQDYVPYFVSAVHESSSSPDAERRTIIHFKEFQDFISSRERSLRRAFDLFDLDGNGRLTLEELEAGLGSVRVGCPVTGCVYKQPKQAVQRLLAQTAMSSELRGEGIGFPDFRAFFLLLPQNELMVDYWLSARCPEQCDIGGCVVMHERHSQGSPWGHLVAGAAAGAVSRTATAPLETLRLQAMTGTMLNPNAIAACKEVMERSGWRGLYRGNLVNVMRSAPQKALDFFAFDLFKSLLGANTSTATVSTFAAAGLAGAASSVLLYPLEVVRSRITTDNIGRYRGIGDAFTKIVRHEGLRALYRGLGPSVAAILPEAAITYGMFDLLKKSYAQLRGGEEPGVVQALAFGVASAFCGQVVAFPLESVSRRLQVQCVDPVAPPLGFVGMLRSVVGSEGPGALYRGVGAASMRVVPMAIVSFGTYELVRLWMMEMEGSAAERDARQVRARGSSLPYCRPLSVGSDDEAADGAEGGGGECAVPAQPILGTDGLREATCVV